MKDVVEIGLETEPEAGPPAVAESETPALRTNRAARPKPSLWRRSWPTALLLLLGLGLGLLAGVLASGVQKPSYLASSSYALIPGTAAPSQPADPQATRPPAESGQLALLTPVIAAIVADPATKAAVDDVVGRSTSATVSPRLIPNSPLLFSVQINGSSPEETFAVAQAYETVMPRVAKVAEVLSGSGAKLGVVTGAEKTEQGQGLPKPLIVLGSGAAGLLVFGAIAWAYANRRRWVRAS